MSKRGVPVVVLEIEMSLPFAVKLAAAIKAGATLRFDPNHSQCFDSTVSEGWGEVAKDIACQLGVGPR